MNLLADSSRQLSEGVRMLVGQTKTMGGGLDQAWASCWRWAGCGQPTDGRVLHPAADSHPEAEFKKAAKLFVSADGHTARYLVQTALNPFGTEAMDQVNQIVKTAKAHGPTRPWPTRRSRWWDSLPCKMIFATTTTAIFASSLRSRSLWFAAVLVVLLRSIVAPLYLVLSVILSYVSALGIRCGFLQFILGQEISWSVPGMTFLVLVAVGADYNLLLISRIRDEARNGVRTAVIRTISATGGVITSAGLIFAASMFGMVFSSISAAVQIGFIIGVGLLLDTFLVRTVTVPAIAALLGNANWWPSKLNFAKKAAARAAQRLPMKIHDGGHRGSEVLTRRPMKRADDATEEISRPRRVGAASRALVVSGRVIRGPLYACTFFSTHLRY